MNTSESLRNLAQDWNALAELDPLWAIYTTRGKEHGQWNTDEFFATGRSEIAETLDLVGRLGLRVEKNRALDFGCGVGRLTQAMAEWFGQCDGIDIAPRMIELARRFNRHGERVQYHLNTTGDLRILPDAAFDFAYTAIVLQHIPPPHNLAYVCELVRLLKRGGVLVFQVPTARTEIDCHSVSLRRLPRWHPVRVWNKARTTVLGDEDQRFHRLRALHIPQTLIYRFGIHPPIQMHPVDPDQVQTIIRAQGAEIVELATDSGRAGHGFTSARFVVRKVKPA